MCSCIQIASNLKISYSISALVMESSMLMDAADIFLNNEHNTSEEKNSLARQIHSDMPKDVGKRVHEEDPVHEKRSITKNKKRRRSIAKEADQKAVSVVSSDGVEIDDNTCRHCLKRFDGMLKKNKHLRQVHKIFSRTKNKIKCNECNLGFMLNSQLRQHLREVHDLIMTEEDYSFPTIEAFKVWKLNIERKEGVFFVTQAGHKTKQQCRRYNYACNRSGIYKPPAQGSEKQRRINYRGSCKIGSYCTAAISCFESKDKVQVKYWPQHYGHGKDIPSELPSEINQSISEAESITGGDSFNDLLKDVRSNLTSQSIQPSATKKRDQQLLKEAFESDDYNSGLSDSESVNHWVRLCLQMEDSPVLFYRQEQLSDGGEEFLLIIMTEFQKQLLMSTEKKVVCVDCLHRRKGGRFYLSSISIVDECDVAFPVAFCISNKVDENVVRQFLMSVKKVTGPLSCTYFMSDSEIFYFDAWKDIMNDTSKWLWSMWFMDYNVQIKLRNCFKSDFDKKVEIYRTIRTLIECHSQIIFEAMFKKYLDSLLDDYRPAVKKFGNLVSNKYSPNVERWAYCYRIDMKRSTSFQLDALHRTLRFCCKEGRKTRLDKFIFVLMKFVKSKMLDRLMNILDDEKIEMVKETINMCHKAGLDISPAHISSLSDKIWLIKCEDEEDNVYVVRDFDSCPEHCMMRCAECDICVHMYSCSCIPSMINANLCQHIHAVVWKFLTPHHFSPIPSPELNDNGDSDSNDTLTDQKNCPDLESVLKMAHEIYKSIRESKSNLSRGALTLIKSKLSEAKECIDVCSGKKAALNADEIIQQVSFLPHSDLPPSLQNSVFQPLVLQALQPNVEGNSSQTLVLKQTEIGLPQDKSLSQQYVIYVPQTKPSSTETDSS